MKEAIFSSYPDGAPGPDVIPFLFYQHFWDLVKNDLLDIFQAFHRGELDPELTHGGSVGVKLNNCESDFLLAGKGLRQGDPISPLLFNLVVDVLTKMLSKGADYSLIAGLCPEVCPRGII